MTIQEYISLKDFTTFKTGGAARFFVVVKSVEELQEALTFTQEKNLPFFILGGGSNILVSDHGFFGVVIKMEIKGIAIEAKEKKDSIEIVAGAGENWDAFVNYTVERGLYGLENLSFIPGTVGAAPVQNIGAYGTEVMNTIAWVEAYNIKTKVLERLSRTECIFSYRDSIFKKEEGKKYIITRVAFNLSKEKKLNLSYKDIAEYIHVNNLEEKNINLKKIREIVISIRTRKLPNVFQLDALGTAGSFFKNPIVLKTLYENLKERYNDMPSFPVENSGGEGKSTYVKIPAAWMLDKLCGFKGYREGNVGVFENQALVLVNFGGATSQEILNLAEKMISCVREKTEITLEREVQIV